MDRVIRPARSVRGEIRVPADKSIAHRAAIIASLSSGTCRIAHYPKGADTLSTLACLRQLGVDWEWDGESVVIRGRGLHGLEPPGRPLDCGNSGTTMRLLTGLLAAQRFDSTLVGDASLMSRPMERVAAPLREMGARIDLRDGRAPIVIRGQGSLSGIDHVLAIPSAQVKSAIILAALTASGASRITEPLPSRDHTERMLALETGEDGGTRTIDVNPTNRIEAFESSIPGDFSSAAFFVVAATVTPDSDLVVKEVGVNPTRTAMLDVLAQAGASINKETASGGSEPAADLRIRSAELDALLVKADVVPRLVDEVPILAVAATGSRGVSRFEGIAELRAKESDRIETTSSALRNLGAELETSHDAMSVPGGQILKGGRIESRGDHRIAMAMAIAGLIASAPTTIGGAECAAVSFPDFWEALDRIAVR